MPSPRLRRHRTSALGRGLLGVGLVLALVAAVLGLAAGPASAATVAGGQLDWGVKHSFRAYIKGPIAHGDITTAGGASVQGDITAGAGAFRFPTAAGGTRTSATAVDVPLAGSVRFTGHDGQLDVTISDLRVTITGSTGTLRADVVSKPLTPAGSPAVTYDDIDFATLTPGTGAVSGLTTTWSDVPAALTAAGAQAFAGFYSAGQALDALDLTVTEAAATTSTTAGGGSTTSTTAGATTSTTAATTSTTADPTTTSSTVAPPAEDAEVVGGRVDWGIKQSFRTYIVGPIAQGSVTPGAGASVNPDGTFRFPVAAADASYGGPADVVAPTTGEVRFQGHHGELDLIVDEVQVQIDGTAAVLFADLSSLPLEADEPEVYDDVALAELDLSGITPTADGFTITWTAVPAVLAAEGAEAFAGFYTPGTALDPVTLVLEVQGDLGNVPTTSSTVPTPDVTLSASTVAVGGSITAIGTGFTPGEQVQAWVHSTPTFAGLATASVTGSVTITFDLPSGIGAGTHKVELRGLSSGRSIFSGDLTVTDGSNLPKTGAAVGALVLLAGLAFVTGGALLAGSIARDRRRTA